MYKTASKNALWKTVYLFWRLKETKYFQGCASTRKLWSTFSPIIQTIYNSKYKALNRSSLSLIRNKSLKSNCLGLLLNESQNLYVMICNWQVTWLQDGLESFKESWPINIIWCPFPDRHLASLSPKIYILVSSLVCKDCKLVKE